MVFSVCVAILAEADLLVAVHDLDLPMRAVETQKGLGSRHIETGGQIGGLDLSFDASSSDMVTLAGNAGNVAVMATRRAWGRGVPVGQEGDGALIDTAMSSIGWSMP